MNLNGQRDGRESVGKTYVEHGQFSKGGEGSTDDSKDRVGIWIE
jgi:hypothetical protein